MCVSQQVSKQAYKPLKRFTIHFSLTYPLKHAMKPVHILLAEDNEGDVLLTKEALADASFEIILSVVKDGSEAIAFMMKEGIYNGAALPDLLLLDVNLPKKNGHEVLKYIKSSDLLRHTPVIMLSTSCSEKDINLSYQNYANCYITKPSEVSDFFEIINAIENFWFSTVKLPTGQS